MVAVAAGVFPTSLTGERCSLDCRDRDRTGWLGDRPRPRRSDRTGVELGRRRAVDPGTWTGVETTLAAWPGCTADELASSPQPDRTLDRTAHPRRRGSLVNELHLPNPAPAAERSRPTRRRHLHVLSGRIRASLTPPIRDPGGLGRDKSWGNAKAEALARSANTPSTTGICPPKAANAPPHRILNFETMRTQPEVRSGVQRNTTAGELRRMLCDAKITQSSSAAMASHWMCRENGVSPRPTQSIAPATAVRSSRCDADPTWCQIHHIRHCCPAAKPHRQARWRCARHLSLLRFPARARKRVPAPGRRYHELQSVHCLASTFRTQSRGVRARASNGTITFATMGRWRKGRVFWKVQAMRFTTSPRPQGGMSSPLKITRPLSASARA